VVPSHERKDVERKRSLWAPFARRIGVPGEGPWVRELGEGGAICAVDSCTPAWTPLSASGEVTKPELDRISAAIDGLDAPVRIAMLHHHVVNPPILHVGRAPWQLGMRLRNAKAVYDAIEEEAREQGLEDYEVREFECLGACDMAPMASIDGPQRPPPRRVPLPPGLGAPVPLRPVGHARMPHRRQALLLATGNPGRRAAFSPRTPPRPHLTAPP
jgi:hypothetical protein